MRRRDFLKAGLIIAAIPVGANMIWKRSSSYRRSLIVKRTHEVLSQYMDDPAVKEALTYLDDALDLTFSIVPEGVGDVKDKDAKELIPVVERFLGGQGKVPLTGCEKVVLDGVGYLIRKNYSNRLSDEAVSALISVCISAKIYQMRTDLVL